MRIGWAVAAVLGAVSMCVSGSFAADRQIIVSAAASLTNAFRALQPAFQEAHPGIRVTLNFAASGALMQQIGQGAPVDVFASADQETMDRAQKADLIRTESRVDFARNALVLAAPADDGRPVSGVQDLVRDEIERVAVGDPAYVPAGRYAQQALRAAGLWDELWAKLVFANSVRQVLDYASRGEVDAGFVYRTDAQLRSGEVRMIQVVGAHTPILYPAAVVRSSERGTEAGRFVAFLLTPEGQAILADYGFQSP